MQPVLGLLPIREAELQTGRSQAELGNESLTKYHGVCAAGAAASAKLGAMRHARIVESRPAE